MSRLVISQKGFGSSHALGVFHASVRLGKGLLGWERLPWAPLGSPPIAERLPALQGVTVLSSVEGKCLFLGANVIMPFLYLYFRK